MSEGNKSTPVDFGSESAAAAVAAAKQRRVPVGGVPLPGLPRLDQPPPTSNTGGTKKVPGAGRVLTSEEQKTLMERGQFQSGVGSAYAVNQPGMSKLPTSPEGEELPIDPKLAPRPPGSGLRPETVKELTGVAAANTQDEDLKSIRKEIDEIDEVFETNEFGERVRSLLANKERCRTIEARCKPLSLEDLLLHGFVKQTVPIVPGKFEPTFRSQQGEENLEILRLIGIARGSEEYIVNLLQTYRLTAGLFAINSRPFPDHLDKNGDFNEELFMAKFKIVKKMALPILADIVVNYIWFAHRVQKLTVVDDIKSF